MLVNHPTTTHCNHPKMYIISEELINYRTNYEQKYHFRQLQTVIIAETLAQYTKKILSMPEDNHKIVNALKI
jgi:hypothetical protein